MDSVIANMSLLHELGVNMYNLLVFEKNKKNNSHEEIIKR